MPSGLDGNPDPIVTPARTEVLNRTDDEVLARRRSNRALLVAVDGIDGSGKSTFADELASVLAAPTVRPQRPPPTSSSAAVT